MNKYYSISDDEPERVIQITDVETYCLEELDFSTSEGGFRQDPTIEFNKYHIYLHGNWTIVDNRDKYV